MTDLTELVENDPQLSAHEKELNITVAGDEKQLTIYSAKKTVVKSLLKNDHFELDWCYGERSDGNLSRFNSGDKIWDHAEKIFAVKGTMPLGTLTIKSKPRSTNTISSVVNAETIDPEAFES